MSMAMKEFFEALAMKANRSNDGQKIMKDWVGHYHGKIIQFEAGNEKFHLLVHDGKMTVADGVYPAPDLTFKASSETLSEVFTGRKPIGDAIKAWELVLVGAGHEGFALGRLVTTVMMEV
jgi:hypothetical protein